MSCCAGLKLQIGDTNLQDKLIAPVSSIDELVTSEFIVPDVHCAGCISKIERGLMSIEAVTEVRLNLSEKRLRVLYDSSEIGEKNLTEKLRSLGFNSMPSDMASVEKTGDETGKQLLLALAVAGFAAANVMLLSVSVWSGAEPVTAKLFQLLSGVIAIPAVLFSGRPFFKSAILALRARTLNMDVPISLAVSLSLIISIVETITGDGETYFDAAITLVFFLLIGRYLDHISRRKALDVVGRLTRLAGKGALLVTPEGDEVWIATPDIKDGMELRILPGDRLPVDAVLLSDQGEFNRALVTGESLPVVLQKDERLEAGVLNLVSPVLVRAEGDAQNSFIAEVSELMEVAQQSKGTYVRIADRFAKLYAPLVHLISLLTFVGWVILTQGDVKTSLWTAVTVLIITCPCALALAVPVAQVIAAKILFSNGIMLKDAGALERLCEVDTAVFDKTGTLTPGVSTVSRMEGELKNPALLIELARLSNHPTAKGISRFVAQQYPAATAFAGLKSVQESAGKGIEACTVDGRWIRLGRTEWAAELVSNPVTLVEAVSGGTAFVDDQGNFSVFFLGEQLRSGAEKCINDLEILGLDNLIYSGDDAPAVRSVANHLGILGHFAELRPEEKLRRALQLQEQGQKVLMVGDGINDAPCLAAAHVSMAPAEGSDIGRASADIVFVRPELDGVPLVLKVARATRRIVFQNFALALLYNLIAIPLAISGFVTPLFAAVAMSSSSLLVVANSSRLNFLFKSKTFDELTDP